jgi:protocatechuate 3,4-dioxygenase beta subunit
MDSRRSFLLKSAGLALTSWLRAQQPFDSLPASAWTNARRNGLIMIHRETPAELFSQARISKPDEPGEPLTVAGRVFAPDGRTPAAGITVYAYNTDAEGYYGANRSEYPPRIYGWMKTDREGRFELRTIRPGRYPNMRVPSHVHFELWGAGYPLQSGGAVQLAEDSYLTAEMIADDAKLGKFHTIREVRGGRCEYEMRLGRDCTFR